MDNECCECCCCCEAERFTSLDELYEAFSLLEEMAKQSRNQVDDKTLIYGVMRVMDER